MIALIAEKNDIYQESPDGPFLDHWSEEIVALFSKEKLCLNYIEKSRLKHPKIESFTGVKRFKSRSLLADASFARIEKYVVPLIPIDPEMK